MDSWCRVASRSASKGKPSSMASTCNNTTPPELGGPMEMIWSPRNQPTRGLRTLAVYPARSSKVMLRSPTKPPKRWSALRRVFTMAFAIGPA